MANPNQLVNDVRGLAVELGDVLDRIEAKLVMSGSLGGDTPGAADGTGPGWLQRRSRARGQSPATTPRG